MTLLHVGVTFVAFNWQHSPFQKVQKYVLSAYMYVSLHSPPPLFLSLALSPLSLTHTQLSFDDIAKYGGVYGDKHSALSTLQSQLQSSQSRLWTGMQGHPATLLTSSLTFNYDLDPEDILGTIQNFNAKWTFCMYTMVLYVIWALELYYSPCWLVCIT